jgi:hypothetical protein
VQDQVSYDYSSSLLTSESCWARRFIVTTLAVSRDGVVCHHVLLMLPSRHPRYIAEMNTQISGRLHATQGLPSLWFSPPQVTNNSGPRSLLANERFAHVANKFE